MIDFIQGVYRPSPDCAIVLCEAQLDEVLGLYTWPAVRKNPYVPSLVTIACPDEQIAGYGVFVLSMTFENGRLRSLNMRWNEGPMSGLTWETVSEESLREEINALADAVESLLGHKPFKKRNFYAEWQTDWGKVYASGETKSYASGIYLEPKKQA